MLAQVKRYAPAAISVFAAAVFLDSLRYKFTDHPKTQEIFGRLDGWAGSLGLPGLFGHTGLFNQYVIGSAELVASTLLLVGLLPRFTRLNALGAAVGFAVMTGAAIGALSGGVSAMAYAMYCPTDSVAFVTTWYTLAIAVCAALGALVGSRFLRW